MKTGRNEPCDCGSGKKFKNCHGDGTSTTQVGRFTWIVGIVVVLGLLALASQFRGESTSPARPDKVAAPVATPPVPTAQPTPATAPLADSLPSDPPPGKVWSEEHGHWHDVTNPSQIQTTTSTVPGPTQSQPRPPTDVTLPGGAISTPTGIRFPQPAGPAPAGQIWSEEHGHWHDVNDPAVASAPANPPIPTSPGVVWSEEHKHWHTADGKPAPKPNQPAQQQQPAATPKPDNR